MTVLTDSSVLYHMLFIGLSRASKEQIYSWRIGALSGWKRKDLLDLGG